MISDKKANQCVDFESGVKEWKVKKKFRGLSEAFGAR